LRGNEVGFCTEQFFDGSGCGWADGGDVSLRDAQGGGEAFGEGFYGVGAREQKPVEGFEAGDGGVEGSEGSGVGELDGGDEDGFETVRAEAFGEGRGLVRGAGDEDAGRQRFPPGTA
jgi:hypothetical protein